MGKAENSRKTQASKNKSIKKINKSAQNIYDSQEGQMNPNISQGLGLLGDYYNTQLGQEYMTANGITPQASNMTKYAEQLYTQPIETYLGLLSGGSGGGGGGGYGGYGGGGKINAPAAWQSGDNPYLDQMVERGQRETERKYEEVLAPEQRRQAAASGAFGGAREGIAQGAMSESLARELGGISTDMRGNAYSLERGLEMEAYKQMMNKAIAQGQLDNNWGIASMNEEGQNSRAAQANALGALALAPTMAKFGAGPATGLMGAGEYADEYPWKKLQNFANVVNGTQPISIAKDQQQSDLMQGLGIGATVFGSMMGSNPQGLMNLFSQGGGNVGGIDPMAATYAEGGAFALPPFMI